MLNKKITYQRRVLIIGLGASTLDVTLVTIEHNVIDALAIPGSSYLGGQDLDTNLFSDLVQEFKRYRRQDISFDAHALAQLRTVCERTKRNLSTSTETTIDIGALVADIDFPPPWPATVLRNLTRTLRKDTGPVRKVLSDGKEEKDSIDDNTIVGGSNRIPKVRQLVSDFFGGKELNNTLDANDAVVTGAAFLKQC